MIARKFFTPKFRSRRYGHRHLTAGALLKIGLIALLAPAGLMVAFGIPILLLGNQLDNPVLQAVGSFAGLGLMAPFIGVYAVPLALLIGAWAMRIGYAGWGVALLAAFVLPVGFGGLYQLADPTAAAIGAMLILSPIVALHAIILWCATRWIAPDTLLTPER